MTKNFELFPDDPLPPARNLLEVVAGISAKQTPVQRNFAQLLADVETAEKAIVDIGELIRIYRLKFETTMIPLERAQDAVHQDMVLFLDKQMTAKGRTARQRDTILDMLAFFADTLDDDAVTDEMATIFKKHFDDGFDDEDEDDEDEEDAVLKATLEEVFGVDLDEEDQAGAKRSSEALWEETLRQMGEDAEKQAAAHQAKANAHAQGKRGGKKSAKQIKAEQENVDATKLLKEVYRKLTSALHPDREPDEAERTRKTALMVEVNKAYAANNLLQLLKLQFQTIKVDATQAANMADEKLVLINRSLKQQLTDLRTEYAAIENMARHNFNLHFTQTLNAKTLDKELSQAKAALTSRITRLKDDIKLASSSEAEFKAWLKIQKKFMNEVDDVAAHEFFDEAFIDEMFGAGKKRR